MVSLPELFIMHLKSRVVSWLTTSESPVTVSVRADGMLYEIVFARYYNGRRVHYTKSSPEIPDTVPEEWTSDE